MSIDVSVSVTLNVTFVANVGVNATDVLVGALVFSWLGLIGTVR